MQFPSLHHDYFKFLSFLSAANLLPNAIKHPTPSRPSFCPFNTEAADSPFLSFYALASGLAWSHHTHTIDLLCSFPSLRFPPLPFSSPPRPPLPLPSLANCSLSTASLYLYIPSFTCITHNIYHACCKCFLQGCHLSFSFASDVFLFASFLFFWHAKVSKQHLSIFSFTVSGLNILFPY